MKKILLSLIALSIITACSEDNAVEVTQCSAVTSLTVTQNFEEIKIVVGANPGALYYEISSLNASGEHNPEYGRIKSLGSSNETLPLEIFLEQQTPMLYYVRTVCADGTKGAWFGPKLVNLQPYCSKTSIVNVNEYSMQWESGYQANEYQMQYGPAGFTLGSGTTVTVNNTYYSGYSMAAGQTYDFYVRANCVNYGGYSAWSQKYSFTPSTNVNMCIAPTNVSVRYESSTVVVFDWFDNGESSFECTLVYTGQPAESGNISRINPGYRPSFIIPAGARRDFYVRAICSNGNRTAWVKKSI